ncbi:DNA primase large subunit PriL [Candidatus Bathyarchaeota archaeon]|nr:DNA primase large subunit PriL [Candidatus Bathyarchaeota archaeon]
MLSEREAAKYPFLEEGVKLVEGLNLQLDDLTDPNYRKVVERAAERVKEAIVQGEVSAKLADPPTELLSYPIAVMFVTLIGEQFLNRRFALAEAVRAYNLLQEEYEEKITQVAQNEFGWDIRRDPENIDGIPHTLKLAYPNYLRAAGGFHEPKWKLVNRKMENGLVSLTGIEAARLLQVEVENWVKERVSVPSRFPLPEPLQTQLDEVKKVFDENRTKLGGSQLPDEVINEAFPPCMRYCLEGLLSGRRASHMERFGLTSFLVNVGMPIDDMVNLYTSVTDFDESLTRYQIEHIAGLKGNRKKYTPPTCATLRTHGICREMDGICKTISHPLSYYRKKARRLERQRERQEQEAEPSNTTTEQ